jgi:hypothetical protein
VKGKPVLRIVVGACAVGAALLLSGCQDFTTGGTGTSGHATAAKQWTMPRLIGANLQVAQDDIQKLTGDPIFITLSHDVSGLHRHQVLDRDWRVCTQNVAAGATFTASTKIDFGVVRLTERCP